MARPSCSSRPMVTMAPEFAAVATVFGQVISIALDGRFILRQSRQYEVAGSDATVELIRAGRIALGETISVVLKEEVAKDRVGLASKPKYRFISMDDRLVP